MGRRILVTGLASFWGGRIAQALEAEPAIDVIVGLDTRDPTIKLERTEFVRADQSYSILARLVKATRVDTILHTFLVLDSTGVSGRSLHETNVIGTMNLLAAAGGPHSSVRHLIVKSSGLVYGSAQRDPTWFREDSTRTRAPRTRVERSLLEVEDYLRDFAEDNPPVTVSVLRFANVLGTDVVTPISKALSLAAVPRIFGFDPLVQFVEEDDVVRALEFVLRTGLSGVYNVAGDGRLPWSEVAHIAGKRSWPLPPMLTGLSAAPLNRLAVADLPEELLDLLRYGRGMDNSKLKTAGFEYRYTSAGAVESFRKGSRLRKTMGPVAPQYRYQRDLETFFRHSPTVIRPEAAT